MRSWLACVSAYCSVRVYPVSRVIFDLPSCSRYFPGRSKENRRVIRVGILSLHRNACHAEKTMNTVTHQPLMLQKCNFSTFYPILCRLILISEQKFLFSEHKYTKQYIAKTKYNLHNRVHRLNWIQIEFKFLTPSCHALDMINSKEGNELFSINDDHAIIDATFSESNRKPERL